MILLPDSALVKEIHEGLCDYYSSSKDPAIIMTRGYNYEGIIDNTLNADQIGYFLSGKIKKEPTVHLVTAYIFKSLCEGQGFNDGNKRTALLTAYYLLCWNGYEFIIPDEAVDFTSKLADATININFFKVVDWLKKHSRFSFKNKFRHYLIRILINFQDIDFFLIQELLGLLFFAPFPPSFSLEKLTKK